MNADWLLLWLMDSASLQRPAAWLQFEFLTISAFVLPTSLSLVGLGLGRLWIGFLVALGCREHRLDGSSANRRCLCVDANATVEVCIHSGIEVQMRSVCIDVDAILTDRANRQRD